MDGAAFILGNSPRLPIDDLGCLHNQFTIGVNRILRSGYEPTVVLWMDGTVYEDDGEQIDASGAILVCDEANAKKPTHHALELFAGDAGLTTKATPTNLVINGSTGTAAARWALALGCKPVYLLGMEAAYKDGQSDFYGQNKYHRPTTAVKLRWELDRLLRDHEDEAFTVPTGEILREIVADCPDRAENELRDSILAAIQGARHGKQ